jgi:hypothetical protein
MQIRCGLLIAEVVELTSGLVLGLVVLVKQLLHLLLEEVHVGELW